MQLQVPQQHQGQQQHSHYSEVQEKSNFSSESGQYYEPEQQNNFHLNHHHQQLHSTQKSIQNRTQFHSDYQQNSQLIRSQFIQPLECSLCNEKDINCLEGQSFTQQDLDQMTLKVKILNEEHASLQKQINHFQKVFKIAQLNKNHIMSQVATIKQALLRNKSGASFQRRTQGRLVTKNPADNKGIQTTFNMKEWIRAFNNAINQDSKIGKLLCFEDKSQGLSIYLHFQPIRSRISSKIDALSAVLSVQNGKDQYLFFRNKSTNRHLIIPLQNYQQSYKFQLYRKGSERYTQMELFLPILFFLEPRFTLLTIQNLIRPDKMMKVVQYSLSQIKNKEGYQILKQFLGENRWFSLRCESNSLFYIDLGQLSFEWQTYSLKIQIGSKSQSEIAERIQQALLLPFQQ